MNSEHAKKILPVVKAMAEGNMIQFLADGQWHDMLELSFEHEHHRYRIKPELHDFLWAVQQVRDETGYTCRDSNPRVVLTKSPDGALRMNQVGMERPRPIYIDEALATDWRFHNNGE